MTLRRLTLALTCFVFACGDGGGAGGADAVGAGDAAPGAADAPPAQPAEVQAAIDLCYEALHGDVGKRGDALDALEAATELYPDNARAFLFLGMCRLSAVAEDSNLLVATEVLPALERAYELAPDDRRIPGWIGTVKVRMATIPLLGSPEAEAEAIEYMIAAADLYPEFNNVSLAIAFASGFGNDTPYPQMALERLESITACVATDPTCVNGPNAPHNESGSMMLYGDVYAKVGDLENARHFYEAALTANGADTWPYRAEAIAMASDVEGRVARFTDGSSLNDPTFFVLGEQSCRGCHE